ncbi:hypothetical protein [Thermogemmatispora carboxidivorans]|uniref:hypothetical protein n=1 Tax=Thermogemmatispora carboxidivorans TaxID=1382306 RepID=UPI00069BAAB7|nr:hypothetical protein [Thermogemmatispora carboxidivorans]
MLFLHRRLIIPLSFLLVVLAILFPALLASPAAHAQARASSNQSVQPHYYPPPCQGAECYGDDPYTTTCGKSSANNSVTLTAVDIWTGGPQGGGTWIGQLYNYYSTACVANWAVVWLNAPYAISIRISTVGSSEHQCYPENCTSYYTGKAFPAWTNMVDGNFLTTACASLAIWGSLSRQVCVNQ